MLWQPEHRPRQKPKLLNRLFSDKWWSMYDGNNVKAWISTVRSAFNACGKSHFLEREILLAEAEYADYCRYFGLMIFTFAPKTIELIQHCKSVFSIWTYMVSFEKDTYASSVRKFIQMLNWRWTKTVDPEINRPVWGPRVWLVHSQRKCTLCRHDCFTSTSEVWTVGWSFNIPW